MRNFNYYNPVKIIFGKGRLDEIGEYIPKSSKIMITYGGGSIKNNGIYESLMNKLSGFSIIEFGGIEPNPHYETLMKGVDIARKEEVGFIIAVGGGSVIDGTKFISAAIPYKGEDEWNIVKNREVISKAIPFGVVLTLPATGSEMNSGAVITKSATKDKLAFSSEKLFPQFSILDPVFAYSLPKRQLSNGLIDSFVHILEQYLGFDDKSYVSERFSEGLLRNIIDLSSTISSANNISYDDMANFMWTATMALNGLIACGVKEDWATHMIGHELTALYGLDHAVSLAIVLPGLLDFVKTSRRQKLLQYAYRVWDIDIKNEDKAISEVIMKTEELFTNIGIKTKFSDYGIGIEVIEKVKEKFLGRGVKYISMLKDVEVDDINVILSRRL